MGELGHQADAGGGEGMAAGDRATVGVEARVVGGDADGVFSKAEQEQLAKDIPGASLDLAPGIGHAFNWDDPEGFVASLRRFLEPHGDGSN